MHFYLNMNLIIVVNFFILILVTSLLKYKNLAPQFTHSYKNFLKASISLVLTTNFILIVLKFLVTYFLVMQWLGSDLFSLIYYENFYTDKVWFFNNVYNNPLGDGLLFICYSTSLICIWYLGDRGVFEEHASASYFSFFLICTTIMTTTTNLLVMFISFEFIFLPSLYFVYILSYSKKSDKTIWFLLLWTLLGALIILFAFSLVYSITNTLDFKVIFLSSFKEEEHRLIYLLFFIGFGIKIPIFPFHYWLTKVHVEAPAGFSMFLSGFLVKTALYCFYYTHLIFNTYFMQVTFIVWTALCIVEASVKMWTQVDIKKLIAYATIQEMNLLLLCLLLTQTINIHIVVIFMILHGLLSTLMFFLVDQIQKRTQTRNVLLLSGAVYKHPQLQTTIWIMLLQFLGIPLTSKFIIEWYVGGLLLSALGIYGLLLFFVTIFFGSIGFFRCWVLILYGTPSTEASKTSDLTRKDYSVVIYLASYLFLLNFLIFVI